MNRFKSLAALPLAVLLLAACSSGGAGTGPIEQVLRGTIEAVDTSRRSIDLSSVDGYTSMLSSPGSGSVVRVYYDGDTTVSFNGTSYRPEDLERGDEVAVSVDESGDRLNAESMVILSDASRVTNESDLSYGLTLRGTVVQVDVADHAIEIDRPTGPNVIVKFEMNTVVRYDDQTFRPEDLERGDEVEVIFRDIDHTPHVMAENITVTRNAGGDAFGGSTLETATVRGTVASIDTDRRTIEIESAAWISNFNGGTTTDTRFVIEYGRRARVEASGSFEPVSGLKPGDVIELQVRNPSGSTLVAQRISIIRDKSK